MIQPEHVIRDLMQKLGATVREVAEPYTPVADGRAAHLCNVPLILCAQFYLQAFESSLTTVGLRLIPFGAD